MKSFGGRVLDLALCLLAATLLLVWAWSLLRPLLPVIIVLSLVIVILGIVFRWRRHW